jgi:hypothetical protein
VQRLRADVQLGPAEHGWADQRWTLARVAMLIGRLFHVRYTLRGVSYLLRRIGFTPQVPAHRAVERDEEKNLVELAVVRRRDGGNGLGGPALTGTWSGQPTPLPLAYVSPR